MDTVLQNETDLR